MVKVLRQTFSSDAGPRCLCRAATAARRPAAGGAAAGGSSGANRKRKMTPARADAGDALGHFYAPEGDADDPDYEGGGNKSGRSSRAARAKKFPYGDDFHTGGAEEPAGARRRAANNVPAAGGAGAAAFDDWIDGFPSVVASGVGGRNVLKIRMPPKSPRFGAGGGGVGSARAAGAAAAAGDVLDMLARAADGMGSTPRAATANGGGGPAAKQPMALLSKSLIRDGAGAVQGARLTLRWEPGSRAAPDVSRRLSEYGLRHHEAAGENDTPPSPQSSSCH